MRVLRSFEHQYSDGGEVEVEILVWSWGQTAAEGPSLTHHTLPASQPHLLLHLVLDEAGHLPMVA